MGISKLFPVAVTLTMMAAATGNLAWVLKKMRQTQLQLIIDSQASKWPKAMTLPSR